MCPTGDASPHLVGARRRLARPRRTARQCIAADHPGSDGRGTAAPFGVDLPALPGRRVRHRLTPTGRGLRQSVAHQWLTGDWPPTVVGARRCLARPRHGRGRFNVADTSGPTRSADQPSGPLHDRPAVNGRAQSPSRLKPADPHGACTQPIDPGAWAPHSPLQGACGLSPGLQPRAFAADHPRRGHYRTATPVGMRCRPWRAGGSGTA